jgi:hypothetical protein
MIRSGALLAVFALLPLRDCRQDPMREAQRRGDPCAFLTKAEAEPVLGTTNVVEEREDNGIYAVCRYRGPLPAARIVELQIFMNDRVPDKDGITAYVEALPSRPRDFIGGIADEALWAADALYVRRGHRFFVLKLSSVESDPPWDRPRFLAEAVARDFDYMQAAPTPAPE